MSYGNEQSTRHEEGEVSLCTVEVRECVLDGEPELHTRHLCHTEQCESVHVALNQGTHDEYYHHG